MPQPFQLAPIAARPAVAMNRPQFLISSNVINPANVMYYYYVQPGPQTPLQHQFVQPQQLQIHPGQLQTPQLQQQRPQLVQPLPPAQPQSQPQPQLQSQPQQQSQPQPQPVQHQQPHPVRPVLPVQPIQPVQSVQAVKQQPKQPSRKRIKNNHVIAHVIDGMIVFESSVPIKKIPMKKIKKLKSKERLDPLPPLPSQTPPQTPPQTSQLKSLRKSPQISPETPQTQQAPPLPAPAPAPAPAPLQVTVPVPVPVPVPVSQIDVDVQTLKNFTKEQVTAFIKEKDPGISPLVLQAFELNEMDGMALLCLIEDPDHINKIKSLNIKLGPALRISNILKEYKMKCMK